jgi:hypothetical protein
LFRQLPSLLGVLAIALGALSPAALAAPGSFEGTLQIVAPVPAHPKARRVPGTLLEKDGKWHAESSYVDDGDKQMPPTDAVDYSPTSDQVSLSGGRKNSPRAFEATSLQALPWSNIPESPDGPAAFLALGKVIAQKGHFIHHTTFQQRKVDEYSFVESRDVFGRVLYDPALGIPLKLEVFNVKTGHRTFIQVNPTTPPPAKR